MSDAGMKDDLNYVRKSLDRLGDTEQRPPLSFAITWALYMMPGFILLEFAPKHAAITYLSIGFVIVLAVSFFIFHRAVPTFGIIDMRKGISGLLQVPVFLIYILFLLIALWFAGLPKHLLGSLVFALFAVWEAAKGAHDLDGKKFVSAAVLLGVAILALFLQQGKFIAFGLAMTTLLFVESLWPEHAEKA